MSNKNEKPIRVLIVNKYFDAIGGIESVVRDLATIDNSNLLIKILVLGKKSNIQKVGSTVVQTIRTQCILFGMPFSFIYPFVFLRDLKKTDTVHVHSPFPLAEWTFVIFSCFFKFKTRLIVTYHSAVVRQKIFRKIHSWFLQRLFEYSDLIVVTSEPMVKNYPGLNLVQEKIKVIPSGVRKPELGFERDYNSFTHCLFVGRLVSYKGIKYLLEALKGTDIKLVIVGTGPLEKDLRYQAERLGIADKIIWEGSVKEIDTAYKTASIFILPSIGINETMGLVQAEAMAYGLPVINTSLPTGVPWVARDGIEAITVHPKDISSLRAAILKLQKDATLRAHLGMRGEQRYKDIFTIEEMKEKYQAIYFNA
jgi:rhamnosyl/mannosyltransferase